MVLGCQNMMGAFKKRLSVFLGVLMETEMGFKNSVVSVLWASEGEFY